MIFDTFVWGVCSVSFVFFVLLGFVGKRQCSRNCLVEMQRSGRSRCFTIYQAVLLKFDSIVVAVMLEYSSGAFALCLLSFLYFLALSANVIFICDGQAHTCHETLHRNLVVAVMLEYVLGYIRPLSIVLQSRSCN
jgi:arginine exporter protein ArgO